MLELLGHFHPLLVHLPIGILTIALSLQRLSNKAKFASTKQIVPMLLLGGSITALISCITGYFLSISNHYNQLLVNWHMWMAIGVVLVSAILYTKEINPSVDIPKKILSFCLLGLLIVTGHFGGSLTHGADYLTKPFLKIFKKDSIANSTIKLVSDISDSLDKNKL